MVPLVVAILYVLTWVVGLSIGAPELSADQDGAAVLSVYAAAQSALLQAVLVHGIAGLLLGVLAVLLARDSGFSVGRRRVTLAAGVLTVLLSWAQLAGEVVLTVGGPSADAAWRVWTTVAVLDGAKMLALAVLVSVTLPRLRARPLRWLAGAAAVSLVASGVGYLVLNPAVMGAAYVSLPLLLVWAICVAVPPRR
jgi:hypothetical protein